jgi:hypothetical protein
MTAAVLVHRPAPVWAVVPAPEVMAVPRHLLPRRSAEQLLADGWSVLAEARATAAPGPRYALAHLAALRGAAAVLAVRARPTSSRRRVAGGRSTAWSLLAAVAPELAEWAAFFAAGATRRAAAESGVPGAVSAREADDLLRDAETFLATVETHVVRPAITVPRQATLPPG